MMDQLTMDLPAPAPTRIFTLVQSCTMAMILWWWWRWWMPVKQPLVLQQSIHPKRRWWWWSRSSESNCMEIHSPVWNTWYLRWIRWYGLLVAVALVVSIFWQIGADTAVLVVVVMEVISKTNVPEQSGTAGATITGGGAGGAAYPNQGAGGGPGIVISSISPS